MSVILGGPAGVGGGSNLFQLSGLKQKPFEVVQTSLNITVDELREQLRKTSAALGQALQSFRTETRPVFTTSVLDSPGITQTKETQTGTVTVSNAERVATEVFDLAEKLNETLTQLGEVEGGPQIRREAEAAIEDAIVSLADAGIGGLNVITAAGKFKVSADREKITSALDAAGSILTAQFDLFSERMANVDTSTTTRPRGAFSPLQLREIVKAQDVNHAEAQLLLAGMLFPETPPRKALDAYSEASAEERRFPPDPLRAQDPFGQPAEPEDSTTAWPAQPEEWSWPDESGDRMTWRA